MCIPLHPYLIGQPHRIEAFEEALRYITGHDKVWLATGREIAAALLRHTTTTRSRPPSTAAQAEENRP